LTLLHYIGLLAQASLIASVIGLRALALPSALELLLFYRCVSWAVIARVRLRLS
jgi:hypothetical protein